MVTSAEGQGHNADHAQDDYPVPVELPTNKDVNPDGYRYNNSQRYSGPEGGAWPGSAILA